MFLFGAAAWVHQRHTQRRLAEELDVPVLEFLSAATVWELVGPVEPLSFDEVEFLPVKVAAELAAAREERQKRSGGGSGGGGAVAGAGNAACAPAIPSGLWPAGTFADAGHPNDAGYAPFVRVPLVRTNCTTRTHSFVPTVPLVPTRSFQLYHSHPLVRTNCTTRTHSFVPTVPLAPTRSYQLYHSYPLVRTNCTTRTHSFVPTVPLVPTLLCVRANAVLSSRNLKGVDTFRIYRWWHESTTTELEQTHTGHTFCFNCFFLFL